MEGDEQSSQPHGAPHRIEEDVRRPRGPRPEDREGHRDARVGRYQSRVARHQRPDDASGVAHDGGRIAQERKRDRGPPFSRRGDHNTQDGAYEHDDAEQQPRLGDGPDAAHKKLEQLDYRDEMELAAEVTGADDLLERWRSGRPLRRRVKRSRTTRRLLSPTGDDVQKPRAELPPVRGGRVQPL